MKTRARFGYLTVAAAIIASACSNAAPEPSSQVPATAMATTTSSITTTSDSPSETSALNLTAGEAGFLTYAKERLGPFSADDGLFILQLGYQICDQMRGYAANGFSSTDYTYEFTKALGTSDVAPGDDRDQMDATLLAAFAAAPYDLCPELIEWAETP